jgi:hypothetical protein
MVQLDPESFECASHNVDLTPQIVEQLEDMGPPVAFPAGKMLGRRSRQREFEVVVSCPGDGTPGNAHQVVCEGRFHP